MQAPLQARNDFDAVQTETARTAQGRRFVDNRPAAVAQRKLAEMINNSPRVLQRRALSDAIHNSPRMVAQRHKINGLLGRAIQLQEDGARPAELSPAQREEKPNNTGLPNQLKAGIQRKEKPNNTGLPDPLKSGIEARSLFRHTQPMNEVPVVQRTIKIGEDEYNKPFGQDTTALIEEIDENSKSEFWKRGWKGCIRDMAREGDVYPYNDDNKFIEYLDTVFKCDEDDNDDELTRPSFPKSTYDLARATTSVAKGKDMSKISLSDNDLAALHRMPYADIRDSVVLFAMGTEDANDLMRWTQRLVDATKQRKQLNLKNDKKGLLPSNYESLVDDQINALIFERAEVIKSWNPSDSNNRLTRLAPFISKLNALHGNVPDLGNHTQVNIPVSNRIHPHFVAKGLMSPGSKAANAMTPSRIKKGMATTNDGNFVVTTDSYKVPIGDVNTKHHLSQTSISSRTLPTKLVF